MRAQSILLISIILLLSPVVWSQAERAATQADNAAAGIAEPKVETSEIGQMPGFPIVLEVPDWVTPDPYGLVAVWNRYGIVLADLDGEGDQELIYSGHYSDEDRCNELLCDFGFIWAWDNTGTMLPGFPVSTDAGAYFAPSIGDLDGDGTLEIVQVTVDTEWLAAIVVVDHLGNTLPGFPITVARPDPDALRVSASWQAAATLYDLDSDGALEIVYSTQDTVHVYEADGSQWENGWPIELRSEWTRGSDGGLTLIQGATPAIADMNGDGAPEIFVTAYRCLYLYETTGALADGWPVVLPEGSSVAHSSAAVADLDGDTDMETIIPVNTAVDGNESLNDVEVFVYHHDGTASEGWPQQLGRARLGLQCPPLVTDLEGDGELDILIAGGRWIDEVGLFRESVIYAWDSSGNTRSGFPVEAGIPAYNTLMLTAADVNGDGLVEVFGDSAAFMPFSDDWDGRGYVIGIDANGQWLPGFPLRPGGVSAGNGVIIGDVDADGDSELAVVGFFAGETHEQTTINLYDLEGAYLSSNRDWTTYHAVNQRGGVHKRAYRGWRVVHAGSRRGGGRK